jgi:hypothetical protein
MCSAEGQICPSKGFSCKNIQTKGLEHFRFQSAQRRIEVRLFLNGNAATSLNYSYALEAKVLQRPQKSGSQKTQKPPQWWLLCFRSSGWRWFYFQSS